MLRLAAATAAFGLVAAPLAASAQEQSAATLTVIGQGQVSRAPDMATVAVAIVTNADNAAHALSDNNRRFASLVAQLGANGVAAGDITSTSVSSYFNPRPSGANANAAGQLYGFIVTRNVEINVAALAKTGPVVDAATAAGATQINGVSFGFHDRRSVERAALAAAVADAYAQAQAIAQAAHVQIVRILRIGDEPAAMRVPVAMSMARNVEAPVPTTITPSDLNVESSISITYVIR